MIITVKVRFLRWEAIKIFYIFFFFHEFTIAFNIFNIWFLRFSLVNKYQYNEAASMFDGLLRQKKKEHPSLRFFSSSGTKNSSSL